MSAAEHKHRMLSASRAFGYLACHLLGMLALAIVIATPLRSYWWLIPSTGGIVLTTALALLLLCIQRSGIPWISQAFERKLTGAGIFFLGSVSAATFLRLNLNNRWHLPPSPIGTITATILAVLSLLIGKHFRTMHDVIEDVENGSRPTAHGAGGGPYSAPSRAFPAATRIPSGPYDDHHKQYPDEESLNAIQPFRRFAEDPRVRDVFAQRVELHPGPAYPKESGLNYRNDLYTRRIPKNLPITGMSGGIMTSGNGGSVSNAKDVVPPRVIRYLNHKLEDAGQAPLKFTETDLDFVKRVRDSIPKRPREFDVFLSYVHGDGSVIANALVSFLEHTFGVRVWFDKTEIRLGDDIVDKMEEGLRKAKAGVVLVTPLYIKGTKWSDMERHALINMKDRLIPILYGTTFTDLADLSPFLATRSGVELDDANMMLVASMIAAAVLDEPPSR